MIVYVSLWVICLCIVSSAPAKKEDLPDLIKALNESKFEHALSLAKEGTGINAKDRNDATPLHLALKDYNMKWNEKEEIVKALLESGADANAIAGNYGWTPLLRAAICGKTEMAKMFMEKGADVMAKTKSGVFTPLMNAASGNYEEIVKTLLKDKRVKDTINAINDNYTALRCARENGYANIVDILEKNGARE
ncbi:ankyrin repeats (3 copies) domain-containing protein [Ditylenchus destructor]|uniref:Ankyrin repeats (3 copies) domain-containing protein n=1 Tax=Ditylenchus destructor TaxID=166010 RepID=A0AAD4MLI4_9BILA|nr:ankyrin repeats (3 copies) domain-containing protein [Ditylenchus destructor]